MIKLVEIHPQNRQWEKFTASKWMEAKEQIASVILYFAAIGLLYIRKLTEV